MGAARARVRVLAFVRRPTAFDLLVTLWWVGLLSTGLCGFLVQPSPRLVHGVGPLAAVWVLSGALVTIPLVGIVARFFEAHDAEAVAAWGIVAFTVLHASVFIFAEPLTGESLQTGLRILAGAPGCAALAFVIGTRRYFLPVSRRARK